MSWALPGIVRAQTLGMERQSVTPEPASAVCLRAGSGAGSRRPRPGPGAVSSRADPSVQPLPGRSPGWSRLAGQRQRCRGAGADSAPEPRDVPAPLGTAQLKAEPGNTGSAGNLKINNCACRSSELTRLTKWENLSFSAMLEAPRETANSCLAAASAQGWSSCCWEKLSCKRRVCVLSATYVSFTTLPNATSLKNFCPSEKK